VFLVIVRSKTPLFDRKSVVSPIRVLVALPEQRPGRSYNLESEFCIGLHASLEKVIQIEKVTADALGHAGGIVCMEQALSLISSGKIGICLVGGVESYLEVETLEWLDGLDQLHSESTIYGFCPGEGAGFCLLVSPELAGRLNLEASVELLSAGSAMETSRIKTEAICIGEGLSEAFKKALSGLPSESVRVDHIICDMNGERYRGSEFGFSMLRSSEYFAEESDFQTPADCWGDLGAASGPLFAILATYAAQKEYAPGPLTFLWASSEGGQRAAALLQATANDGEG
jgi:3-oxoacyl-[acyl-carrier-protein] synthase-1